MMLVADVLGLFWPARSSMQITSQICSGWSDSTSLLNKGPLRPLRTVQ